MLATDGTYTAELEYLNSHSVGLFYCGVSDMDDA